MYSLVNALPARQLLWVQAPALIGSFVIADLFYKWGSFALECVGFLATWFVLDVIARFLLDAVGRKGRSKDPG